MAEKGWIKLHRSLQECWIWLDKEPFEKRSAWIDLLLTANHSDKKILFNNELIIVKRGQILTSVRKLSERWRWSYDKTLRYLKLLERDGMLQRESDRFRTLLTIVKYEVYQEQPITNRTPISEPISEQISERPSDKQECKELKNINNNSLCKKDAQSLFEELWKLYPVKRGKGQVSDTAKMRLLKIGREQMIRAIERYKTYVDKQKNLNYQNGSTFFNSGYVDYIDENYTPNDEKPKNQSIDNRFNNFEGRTYDMSSLEQQLLNN